MATEQTLRIVGTTRDGSRPTTTRVEITQARQLMPGATRGGGEEVVEVAVDDVVRIEFDNGFVLWGRADDLVRERGRLDTSRSGGSAWRIDTRPPPGEGTRGALGIGIRLLEVFGVDLKEETATRLADWWELRQLEERTGLFRCSAEGELTLTPVAEGEPLAADGQPILVFLHGTGASCRGSFGALWEALGADTLKALGQHYGERIFAWEHRTLTESPIQNALALAQVFTQCLSAGAEVHLVSHSRGGLVGELLCLGERDPGVDPVAPNLFEALFAADRTMADQLGLNPLDPAALAARDQAYQEDRARLSQLVTCLAQARLRIRRFVRVACPARGTTLASGRLDRWLSMLRYLAPAGVAGDALDFLLAVAKERTDPRTLPGLEAMLPGSALTRLLQHPDLITQADLSVIAGDLEDGPVLAQIKRLAVNWFFGGDHDLVVNTGSMTGGLRRTDKGARALVDKGPKVTHFDYFRNPTSQRWLLAGLTRADGESAGFRPIGEAPQEAPRWRAAVARSRSGSAPRPLAVLLPGTLGSELRADGRDIWLDYWALARGGLGRLCAGTSQVEPAGVLDRFYGPLIEFLAGTHRVEVFAYDWRLSVRTAAAHLADRLADWLREAERARQPVHLVAHSMGGLVVRAMLADLGVGADLWRRIGALPESRFLMLGTPNQGSYEAVRWLTGTNPTQAKLTLLDLTRDANDMVDLVRAFPGLLELLPSGAEDPDFTVPDLWTGLRAALQARWPTAAGSLLREVRDTWAHLRTGPIDPARMLYVAGSHTETVSGYRLEPQPSTGGQRLAFRGTAAGDGTVTWRSGVLPGVPVWYAPATPHDELCRQRRLFPAYLDLLMTGRTTRLAATPPAQTRDQTPARIGGEPGAEFDLPPTPPCDGIPDQQAIEALGFGPSLPITVEGANGLPAASLTVKVKWGNLAYARYPVLVGHYQDDTIVNAERALDERLGGALSRRLALGLYPGVLGSHALVLNDRPDGKPVGALVIGLGQVGGLSPSLLEAGVRDALLDYALAIAQWPDARFGDPKGVRSAALSCLLVGSGAGGMGVADALGATLRGAVAAADRLRETGLDNRVIVDCIEFIELYQDVAIDAAAALTRAIADPVLVGRVSWQGQTVAEGQGGQTRLRCEQAAGWWQRLEVIEDRGRDCLRFIASTDRARAEVTLATGQLRLADGFITQAARSAAANAEVSKTLFEMLLPNRLRELAPYQSDLVMMVDEVSARFPWELLEDRWSQAGRPPAVAHGMVRQLKTMEGRTYPAHASAPKALVVGNPDLDGWADFADLPGARSEATQVAGLLRERRFDVLDVIGERADAILNGLHKDAWRILHLAGHGEHEFPLPANPAPMTPPEPGAPSLPTTVSGLVIGRDTFLTAGDVEQMRWVPELVFINACHLGKTQRREPPPYQRLAANLAVQFIRMGVRAVIAAGWAVDDAAATTFAETFYGRMLDGLPFGEAVRAAREACWTRHPEVNTWGAYQCYGDPSFRLRGEGAAPLAPPPTAYFDPVELVTDLGNLAASLRMERAERGNDPTVMTEWRGRIDGLLARIPAERREDWLKRADVAAALGFAWGEMRAYGEAIDWLKRALGAKVGDCPLRTLERCNDYRIRLVGEQWLALRSGAGGAAADLERQGLLETVDQGIRELAQIAQLAPTVERLSLLGWACMRLAWLQSEPRGRLEALVNMAQYFGQAIALAVDPDPVNFPYYAMARLLVARLDRGRGGDWEGRLEEECLAMAALARGRTSEEPTLLNSLAIADCTLVAMLAAAHTGSAPVADSAGQLAGLYRDAFARGASPQQIAWARDRLEFLLALDADPHGPAQTVVPAPAREVLMQVRELV